MTLELADLSFWNRVDDWDAVRGAGLAGVIAKASEGDGYEDPSWRANQAAMLASPDLVCGSYWFARPDLANSPEAEAAWYLSRHDPAVFAADRPWIFALDAESAGGSDAWCRAGMDFLASRLQGLSPWFYSFSVWIASRRVQAFNRPLWLAWPDSNGDVQSCGWPTVTMQQYGTRSLPGVTGLVDANRFFGDRRQLLILAGISSPAPDPDPAPPQPPVPSQEAEMKVYSVAGDTDNKYGLWVTDGVLTRHIGSPDDDLAGFFTLQGGGTILQVSEKTHLNLVDVASLAAPPVDVVALANALAPHLPPQIDPAVVAAQVIERLGKDLSAAGS